MDSVDNTILHDSVSYASGLHVSIFILFLGAWLIVLSQERNIQSSHPPPQSQSQRHRSQARPSTFPIASRYELRYHPAHTTAAHGLC